MRHRTNALKWLGVSAKSLVAIGLMSAMAVQAEEVTPEQAQTAARNWIRKNPCPMTAQFATVDGEAKTYFMDGRALFHVVQLDGGGFVITSGDTKLPPVIAFSGTGSLDLSDEGNPLNALLKSDLGQRTAAIGRTPTANAKRQMLSASVACTSESTFEEQWAELLVDAGSNAKESSAGLRLMSSPPDSISDVRVAPLVQSKWDQGQWNGENTFNRFIPNNYNCGCVATATAQIMRYWQMPKSSVAPGTYKCWVNHEPSMLTMKGGKYDWENMPLTADRCTTDTQRNAIGTLLYDVGIALQMDWHATEDGSAGDTSSALVTKVLREQFGYVSARQYHDWWDRPGVEGDNISLNTEFRNAILASLDAGMPVALELRNSRDSGGHAIVVDGYGFNGDSTIYCHLNCGWSGDQDTWYNLIGEPMTSHGFAYLSDVAYNIHPTKAGDVISGRILAQSGSPVSGATVVLVAPSGSRQTVISNGKGIYSFRAEGGNYVVSASFENMSSDDCSVDLPAGENMGCTRVSAEMLFDDISGGSKLGNAWGVDLVLIPRPDLYPQTCSDWSSPLVVSTLPDTIYSTTTSFSSDDELYVSWFCGNKGTTTSSDFASKLFVDGKCVWSWGAASGLQNGQGVFWKGLAIGKLSVGSHVMTIVYDYDGQIAESDENNNSYSVTITVSDPMPDLCFFSPEGWVTWPHPVFLSNEQNANSAQTSFAEGETIYLNCRFGNKGTTAIARDYRIIHEVLNSSGSVRSSLYHDCTFSNGEWCTPGEARQWGDAVWSILQGLPVGNYTYRCRLDTNCVIDESDEKNNVREIEFAVVEYTPAYKVTFGKNGGTGGDDYVTATYGAAMPTPRKAPTQSGWTFAGYWDTLATDEKGGAKGKQYYDASMKSVRAWDKTSATTLWAKWTNKVTLGKNGGTGGDSYVTCTKGQPMPKRTMPTKAGYVFDGYWTSTGTGGVKYYNADGTSAHAWDNGGSVTLWAKWVAETKVKVTFGKNGGTGGDNYVTATTGKAMPTPRTAPTLKGWSFGGYWDTLACDAKGNPLGKQYYNSKMESVRAWDKTTATTLWAKWTVKVTLGKNGGTGGDSTVTVIKGQPFPKRTMPTKSGYTFGGYFVSASSKTGQCYNPDGTGTSSMKWTTGGTPTVWALWTKTSACVELPPAVARRVATVAVSATAPGASAAPTAAPALVPAGLYSGVLADGSGAFWLVLDESEEGSARTAYLYIASEAGSLTAECEVTEAGDVLLLTTEDGEEYAFDPATYTLGGI